MSASAGTTMRPMIDMPDDETLDRIDFVIQGLENGQFKDLTKKVDFQQKLKGEDSKRFVKSLVEVIEAQACELGILRSDLYSEQQKNMDLQARVDAIEFQLIDYTKNMRGIANALAILADPQPPLSGGLQAGAARYYNEADAEQFISGYKDKY